MLRITVRNGVFFSDKEYTCAEISVGTEIIPMNKQTKKYFTVLLMNWKAKVVIINKRDYLFQKNAKYMKNPGL
jgi:hypothetical protein